MLVAKSNSISNAAKSMSVTISPVSRLISELESLCGKSLFYRTGNKIILSEDGKKLYDELYHTYETLREIEKKIKSEGLRPYRTIYYDWSQEESILSIQILNINEPGLTNIAFKLSNHFNDEDGIYFTSEEFISSTHTEFIKSREGELCLFFSGEKLPTNKLFLTSKQEKSSIVNKSIGSIMNKFNISNSLVVTSESVYLEMIHSGYGAGICTKLKSETSVWRAHKFNVIRLGIYFVSRLYMPDSLSEVRLRGKLIDIHNKIF